MTAQSKHHQVLTERADQQLVVCSLATASGSHHRAHGHSWTLAAQSSVVRTPPRALLMHQANINSAALLSDQQRRAPIASGAERGFHECTDYRHMLAGKTVGLSFSLLYAAPETVAAFVNGKRAVVADSAVDTFAFGIMCYELLTRTPFYPKGLSGADVGDMLAGRREMPHETMSVDTERKLGTLKRCAAAHRFGFPR